MPLNEDTGGYSGDRRLIEHRLDALDKGQDKIGERLDSMALDVAAIKTQLRIEPRLRGGMFGVAGGGVTIGLIEIIKMLLKGGAG